jgi:prevent-host-death family protein
MKTVSVTRAKAKLNEIVREVQNHENYYLTKNGRIACVLVNLEEWESIQETLAVLGDQELMRQLAESERSETDYSLAEVFGDG